MKTDNKHTKNGRGEKKEWANLDLTKNKFLADNLVFTSYKVTCQG